MDDDPGRLVDHEQVLVLVGDPEGQLLRLEALRCLERLEGHFLAAFEPVALGAGRAVHEHAFLRQQALRGRPRAHLRQRGEEPVEPLARSFGWNAGLRQALRVSPTTSARKRIATPITMNESARLNAGQ